MAAALGSLVTILPGSRTGAQNEPCPATHPTDISTEEPCQVPQHELLLAHRTIDEYIVQEPELPPTQGKPAHHELTEQDRPAVHAAA